MDAYLSEWLPGNHPLLLWIRAHRGLVTTHGGVESSSTWWGTVIGSWAAASALVSPQILGALKTPVLLVGPGADHPLVMSVVEQIRLEITPMGRKVAERQRYYVPDASALFNRGGRGGRDVVTHGVRYRGACMVGHLDIDRWRPWAATRHVGATELVASSLLLPTLACSRRGRGSPFIDPLWTGVGPTLARLKSAADGCTAGIAVRLNEGAPVRAFERWAAQPPDGLPTGMRTGRENAALFLASLLTAAAWGTWPEILSIPYNMLTVACGIVDALHSPVAIELARLAHDSDYSRSAQAILEHIHDGQEWYQLGEFVRATGLTVRELQGVLTTMVAAGDLEERASHDMRHEYSIYRLAVGPLPTGDQIAAERARVRAGQPVVGYAKTGAGPQAIWAKNIGAEAPTMDEGDAWDEVILGPTIGDA